MSFRSVDRDRLQCSHTDEDDEPDCSELLDPEIYKDRKTGLCDRHEVQRLTPEAWLDDFLVKLDRWDFYRNHIPNM